MVATVSQIYPTPSRESIADLYDISSRKRHHDRPWVVMTMISAADGAIAVDGHSAALGNPTDREIFLTLRRSAHVILVGGETVRADAYSPVPDHQILVVVSQSGHLGPNHEALIAAPSTRVVSGSIVDITRDLPGAICVLEGGPSLNGQMLAADLVDEVCLTLAPRFPAGTAARLAHGPLAGSETWELGHIAEDEGFVFLRYLRHRSK